MWLGFCSDRFREEVWPLVPEAGRERVDRFAVDLIRYNRAQNLISRREPRRRFALLVEECVVAGGALARRGFSGSAWADVGSGAGFPGLLLACVDPLQSIVLIERRRGRCEFLRRELLRLGLESSRVLEADASGLRDQAFDLVLAKAVAPPGRIEKVCDRVVADSGTLAVFGRPEDEAAEGWTQEWTEPLHRPGAVLRGLRRVVP
jgi:16S rRNA (guanine527-N7)-methyltransferase